MPIPFTDAADIDVGERDFNLNLDSVQWPRDVHPRPRAWTANESGWLSRIVTEDDSDNDADSPAGGADQMAGSIRETILRFPSAPIHGLHRLHEYHVNEGQSENLHTYRILTHPNKTSRTRVRRIFFLHNGLNETPSMSLYYRLASNLIHQQDGDLGTVCVVRPFPGHLTRSRFSGFAETPLDHYLWDGSHLFRQFLRYMIETQWFLSVIVRRSAYRCISGLDLLGEHTEPSKSRLEDHILATRMREAWGDLYNASDAAIKSLDSTRGQATPLGDPPPAECFEEAIKSLRLQLNLTEKANSEMDPSDPAEPDPELHVVGYSLGGFMAQSVFMSWPFLIASCSTLLSGGALRELAPTAFAHPEEWQTVLHSLRYELDDAMLMRERYQFKSNRVDHIERGTVSGVEFDLFLFLKSTFYEVFQQEYRGSFQTRLSSFRQRMLFIIGGNDPIVRPQSVLDSAPPGGVNMLTIGGIGHFLGRRSADEEEEQQRSFWVPEVGRLISTLADEAGEKLTATRRENWLDADMHLPPAQAREADECEAGGVTNRLTAEERMEVDAKGTLDAQLFQRCLDDLLARTEARRGVLFILRNEIPTVLLEEKAIQQLAAGMHHDDPAIVNYIEGIRRRRELILANPERVSLLLPWNTRTITENMDAHPGHPSQAEGSGGQMPKRVTPSKVWEQFLTRGSELADESPPAIRICDGRRGVSRRSGDPAVDTEALAAAARKRLGLTDERVAVKPSMPDCWVWISPEFLGLDLDDTLTVAAARERICKVVPEQYVDEHALSTRLRRDQLRIVTVSRARYNPRFRGRLVVDPRVAKTLLLHIALCIAVSAPFDADTLHAAPTAPAPVA